jgi:hypothetical protein
MWTKAQAQAKFLAAASTIRFLIARPPCRPASGHYYITAAERGAATADHCGFAEEDEAVEGQRRMSDEDRLALPLITSRSSSETSPRSRDSGNMSIDSDKSFEGTRNRLSSSSSSKDSGHRSSGGAGSIDRSTTNSSKSEASSLEGSVQSDPGHQQQQQHQQQQKIDGIAGDLKKSQSLFSIDSDFMFVSTKNDQPDDRSMLSIRPGNHHNPLVFRKDYINNNNNNNHHQLIGDNRNNPLMTIIDPIYEMISEQSEPEADMYCLPVDSMRPSAVAATAVGVTSSSGKPVFNNSKMAAAAAASPEHVGKKTRSRSSDQVKMLAKSASGNQN